MTDTPAIGHNTEADAASYLRRACNILDEIDTLKEDLSELKKELKAQGIDPKAFALALKEKRKPIDAGLKAKVNAYLEQDGQFQLFA